MSWATPTEADLLTRCSGAELEAFRSVALGEDQADPVAAIIAIVARHMRSYLDKCTRNVVDEDKTKLPPEALHSFLDLVVPVIQQRPAGAVIDPNGLRLDARRDVNRWLEQASRCEVFVEGQSPGPGAAAGEKPTFKGRKRKLDYDG